MELADYKIEKQTHKLPDIENRIESESS